MRVSINTDLLLSLLFSSSLKADTKAIFITTNGKLFQGIGITFPSEIDGWRDI